MRTPITTLKLTVAAAALSLGVATVMVPSPSLADPPGTQTIETLDTGVYEVRGRFPDEVGVYAEQSDAGQHKCASSLTLIKDMSASFETRESGLAHVLFCGELDNYGDAGKWRLAARIDDNDDCITIRGDTFPDVSKPGPDGGNDDGLHCWQFMCKVDNNHQNWVSHTIELLCQDHIGGSSDVQFNDRNMQVRYQHNTGPQ